MDMFLSEHVLWMAYFEGDMHYLKTCLTRRQVSLLVGLLYRRACIAGENVLQEDLFYWRANCAVECVV